MNAALAESRLAAAEASGGTSNEVIYARIEAVIAELGLTGSVLDLGAGTANLARKLRFMDALTKVSACDILPKPVDLPSEIGWIRRDLNEPLDCPEPFDLVIAAEVIEHLENPRALARNVFDLLRPGGTFLLTTPNNESWRSIIALLVRGHFVAFSDSCYPAHISALLRRDVYRLLNEAGFESVQFRFTDNGGIPGRPTVSWQTVSRGLLNGLRFSDNFVAIAKKPFLC